MREVEISYLLEHEGEAYKVSLECILDGPEDPSGWQGKLKDYEVLSVTPAWPHGIETLYESLNAGRADIEANAMAVEEDE